MEQLPDTPDDAIALAMAGTRRFVQGNAAIYPQDVEVQWSDN